MAADAGADMGLIFPRNDAEMKKAPKQARIPLVYVTSRGNRDGRPVPTAAQLADMGYKAAIDAMTYLLASFHFAKLAYGEIKRTGGYTGLSHEGVRRRPSRNRDARRPGRVLRDRGADGRKEAQ